MIKEATASTFLVRREGPQMLIALAWHPRLEGWLPAGGHVEDGETEAEAALREVAEETGLRGRLLPLPLPASFPHLAVPGPWWTVEIPACPDNHTRVEHLHIDHVFVAEVASVDSDATAECDIRWFTEAELAQEPDVSEDSRIQGLQILDHLQRDLVAARGAASTRPSAVHG